jgi:putative ABC transport system permease protein
MTPLFQDVRSALRLLRRQPAFSGFVVLTLAFGIGAATTVFTLVQAVLLSDLPFADPDRLVWMYNLRTERDRAPLSIPDLNDYERDAASIEGFAPFTNWTANLTGAGEAERLEGVRVARQLLSTDWIARPARPGAAAER